MSVINNVLKDLKTRDSQFTPIEITSIEAMNQAAPRKSRPVLYAVLLLLLLACAVGGYLYRDWFAVLATAAVAPAPESPAVAFTGPRPAAEVTPASAAVSTVDPRPALDPVAMLAAGQPPATADAVPVNQIVGLQIRESETEMRLEFALRERAVAYLKERGENHFAYHLRDTESRISAPLMRNNPWIRTLAIEESTGGVDIEFTIAAGTLVETRQLRSDGEPMWVIDLRRARPAEAVHSGAGSKVQSAAAADTAALPPAKSSATAQIPAPAAVEAAPAAPVKVDIKATSVAAATASQLEYAVELMNSGRSEDAENLLLRLLGGNDDYRAREHLMALYSRHERPARLRSLLLASLQEYPGDPLFRSEYALALFQTGAYRQVIELLVQDGALDARQSALLAASYQRLDQHEAAVSYYRQALRQDAADARNWVGLGISQEQTGAFAEALESYRKAAILGGLNARLQAFVDRRSDNLRQVVD